MSLHRVLVALLSALGVAVLFTSVGWLWAFWVVLGGSLLALGWPLLRWCFVRS